jgi:hypothetical protein
MISIHVYVLKTFFFIIINVTMVFNVFCYLYLAIILFVCLVILEHLMKFKVKTQITAIHSKFKARILDFKF